MLHKYIIASILFFILFSNHTLFAQNNAFPEKPLIGIWIAEKASRSGLKSILEFKKNGVFIHRQAVILNYKYKVDGNSITVFSTEENAGEKVIFTGKVAVVNDNLELQFDGEDPKSLTREDNWKIPANQKYIGHWLHKESSGRLEYYIFDREENFHFRILMPGRIIRVFAVVGNSIEIRRNLSKVKNDTVQIFEKTIEKTTMEWKIEKKSILSLIDTNNNTFIYERFE